MFNNYYNREMFASKLFVYYKAILVRMKRTYSKQYLVLNTTFLCQVFLVELQ